MYYGLLIHITKIGMTIYILFYKFRSSTTLFILKLED